MTLAVQIVLTRYGFLDGRPRSVAEVAREHGLSPARVRRLEARLLARLRRARAARRDHAAARGVVILSGRKLQQRRGR